MATVVNSPEQLVALGAERLKAHDSANAANLFMSALSSDIDNAGAWQNLSTIALGPGRYAAAIAICRRAVATDPDDPLLWVNLGNALWRAQRFPEAEPWLRKGVAALPDHAGAHQNLGLLLYSIGDAEGAVRELARAVELEPETASHRGDHAHAVLKSGDLARGLDLLEVRWEGLLPKNAIWDCGLPKWDGGPDEVMLLHHEQGIGDTLQFCRFIPQIKQAACADRIIFAAPKSLHRLLEGQCGIDELIDEASPGAIVRAAMKADSHCPLMSAVATLKPTYQAGLPKEPYLSTPGKIAFDPRAGSAKLAVGVVWGAAQTVERGPQKSVPIDEMLELDTIPGVKLWSLQFGPYADDLKRGGAEFLIQTPPGGLGDFADTAAIMANLDLVVSIDTAAAHLAGAIGKKCFVLNPINPCWRWCNGAEPWYDNMVLFDQVEPDNWRVPIRQVARCIQEMLHT